MTGEVVLSNRKADLVRITFPSGNVKFGIFRPKSNKLIRGMWESEATAREIYFQMLAFPALARR